MTTFESLIATGFRVWIAARAKDGAHCPGPGEVEVTDVETGRPRQLSLAILTIEPGEFLVEMDAQFGGRLGRILSGLEGLVHKIPRDQGAVLAVLATDLRSLFLRAVKVGEAAETEGKEEEEMAPPNTPWADKD